MGYISASDVAIIRKKLKEEFGPMGYKFSVVNRNGNVDVSIMQSPKKFYPVEAELRMLREDEIAYIRAAINKGEYQLNPYYLERYENSDDLKAMLDIILNGSNNKYYNNSDSMVDYFDVAFYYSLDVGKWDKPCVYVEAK